MKITINLLPPEKKEEFEVIKKIRLISKIYFFVYLAIFIFAGFLFSCLFIIQFQQKFLSDERGRLMQNDIYKRVQETQDKIEEHYKKVVYLDKELRQERSFSDYLNKINNSLEGGIFLTELAIDEEKIQIKGFSETRENLIKFKEKLEKVEEFKDIEFPISNFVSSRDINFDFVINLKKEKS